MQNTSAHCLLLLHQAIFHCIVALAGNWMQLTRTSHTLPWSTLAQNLSFPTGGVEGELFLNTWLLLLQTKVSQFRRSVLATEKFGQQCSSKCMTAPVVSLNVLARARLILGRLSSFGQAVRHAMLEDSVRHYGRVKHCMCGFNVPNFDMLQLLGPLTRYVHWNRLCHTKAQGPKSQVEIQAVHNCKGDHLRCCFIHFTVACKLLEWYLLQNQKTGLKREKAFLANWRVFVNLSPKHSQVLPPRKDNLCIVHLSERQTISSNELKHL